MSAIFVSHSSKDRAITEHMASRLSDKGYGPVFVDFDPEEGIPAGRNWEHEIYQRLRGCRAVVVLCSEHSMTSDWCFAEIAYARALGKHIFPVKVAPCTIKPILRDRQIVDLTGDIETAFSSLWRGIESAGLNPADIFAWRGDRPPYPGLAAFTDKDAAVFFGRDSAIRHSLDKLSQLQRFGGSRLLVLIGASGSGKSSLVRAGLIPRLAKDKERWIVLRPIRPSRDPLRELKSAIGEKAAEWAIDLSDGKTSTITDTIAALPQLSGRANATVLLVIDQMEEALTHPLTEQHREFLYTLATLLKTPEVPVMAIVTLRSDFLATFQESEELLDLATESITVNPPSLNDLSLVIEGPARIAGIELQEGLSVAMVAETGTYHALPLLAFTLRELWEQGTNANQISLDDYRRVGGVHGSIARVAEAVLRAVALKESDELDLRMSFLAMARLSDSGVFVRRRVQWKELPAHLHSVLERFVQARLLISDTLRDGERTLEVAHEALFHTWDRLHQWLDEDVGFLEARTRLESQAIAWEKGNRAKDLLLPSGQRLAEGADLLSSRQGQLQQLVVDYIKASIDTEKSAKERELERAREHAIELESALVSAELRRKEAELNLADSRTTEGAALTMQRQYGRGRERYAEAFHLYDQLGESTFPARIGYLCSVQISRPSLLTYLGHSTAVTTCDIEPTGRLIVSGAQDGEVLLWDLLDGQLLRRLHTHQTPVVCVGFSQDSNRCFSADRDGRVEVYEMGGVLSSRFNVCEERIILRDAVLLPDGDQLLCVFQREDEVFKVNTANSAPKAGSYAVIMSVTGQILSEELRIPSTVYQIALFPSGSHFLAGSMDTTVVCALQPLSVIGSLSGETGVTGHKLMQWWPVLSVAVSADERYAAMGCGDGVLEIWDIDTWHQLHTQHEHNGGINDVVFNSDGDTEVVYACGDGSLRTFSLGGKRVKWDGHTEPISGLAIAAGRIVSAGEDQSLRLWAAGEEVAKLNGAGLAPQTKVSSDGRLLLTVGMLDTQVQLWDIGAERLVAEIDTGQEITNNAAIFIGELVQFLVGHGDGSIQQWDAITQNCLATYTYHETEVTSIASSANTTVVSGDSTGKILVWDIRNGNLISTLDATASVKHLAISSNGQTIVAVNEQEELIAWQGDSLTPLWRVDVSSQGGIESIAISHDGKHVATGHTDTKIRVWEINGGQPTRILSGHANTVTGLAFADDARVLVSSGFDGYMRVWNAADGAELIASHLMPITSLSMSGTGVVSLGTMGDPSVYGEVDVILLDSTKVRRYIDFEALLASTADERMQSLKTLSNWYSLRREWKSVVELVVRMKQIEVDPAGRISLAACHLAAGNSASAIKILRDALSGDLNEADRLRVRLLLNSCTTLGAQFLGCAESGNATQMQEMLESGASIDAKNEDGVTALHLAARNGHLEVVKLLLAANFNIEQTDNQEHTALLAAAHYRQPAIVRYLIEHGANVRQANTSGRTALHLAAFRGDIEILELLIEQGADIQRKDEDGKTAYDHAISGSSIYTEFGTAHWETVFGLVSVPDSFWKRFFE